MRNWHFEHSYLLLHIQFYCVHHRSLLAAQTCDIKHHKLHQDLSKFTWNCGYGTLTMLHIYINENNAYTSRQHTYIGSYCSIVCYTQPTFNAFNEWFPRLEAVIDFQNSTEQLLSTSSYLLIHFPNFLGPKNPPHTHTLQSVRHVVLIRDIWATRRSLASGP